jgi:hypothetical protein
MWFRNFAEQFAYSLKKHCESPSFYYWLVQRLCQTLGLPKWSFMAAGLAPFAIKLAASMFSSLLLIGDFCQTPYCCCFYVLFDSGVLTNSLLENTI